MVLIRRLKSWLCHFMRINAPRRHGTAPTANGNSCFECAGTIFIVRESFSGSQHRFRSLKQSKPNLAQQLGNNIFSLGLAWEPRALALLIHGATLTRFLEPY